MKLRAPGLSLTRAVRDPSLHMRGGTMMHRMFQGYACTRTLEGQSAARLVVGLALLLGLLLPALTFADVGHNSCVGQDACTSNTGDVQNNACHGRVACFDNTGAVGNNSC